METKDSLLFRDFTINDKFKIKNRIVMAPVYLGRDIYSGEFEAFYLRRARGGTGLIIAPFPTFGGLEDLDKPLFARMARSLIEKCQAYGCKIIPQIFSGVGEWADSMRKGELERLVERMARAALRVKAVGFEGLEIHGAHHSLFMQLLSPLLNKRTDEYGSTQEDRCRLQIETVKAVRSLVGEDFAIFLRFSATDFAQNGVDLSMTIPYAKMLEEAGVDCLDISAGGTPVSPKHSECPDQTQKEGCFSEFSARIKEAVTVPVITAGRITGRRAAEDILREKKADLIGVGRALVADPDWADKLSMGLDNDILPVDEWYKQLPMPRTVVPD